MWVSSIVFDFVVTDEEMEAERQSLYKAIGYAEGKAVEPFAKEVYNIEGLYVYFILSSVTIC